MKMTGMSRESGSGLERFDGLKAVHAGHLDVEENEVRLGRFRDLDGPFAAFRLEGMETLLHEGLGENLQVLFDVVDDQDPRLSGL